jgi:hypothetical protein
VKVEMYAYAVNVEGHLHSPFLLMRFPDIFGFHW